MSSCDYSLFNYLFVVQLDGFDLPDDLPDHLIPPSKKRKELISSVQSNFSQMRVHCCGKVLICTLYSADRRFLKECFTGNIN